MTMSPGTKFVAEAPAPVVGLCHYKDRLFVATATQVFEMIDGAWHPMVFVVPDGEPARDTKEG